MNAVTRLHFARHHQAWLAFGLCWLLGIGVSGAGAYELEGVQWPQNYTIVLDLQLGSPQGTLIDGSTSWDQVVAAATEIWNPYVASGVQFATQETSETPAQGDGKNTVFFASSVFGEGFGDDTLATTAYLYKTSSGVETEADVVFNVAQSFNSYRGALRTNGTAPVYDLRRIILHEIGHVLGLAHVPQTAQAIMTPVITDIDTIQPDDIAGVESIYGNPAPAAPVINESLSDGGLVGESFEYRISATNNPTSFSASSLPPGLSVNTGTGSISGTPTMAGTYAVTIGATNNAGTGTATLNLVFAEKLTITGDLNGVAYVGRPYYYQVTTTGEATSFQANDLPLPTGLSLDQSTGLISGTPTAAGDFRFQVETTGPVGFDSELFELVIAYDATLSMVQQVGDIAAMLKGSDGNLYGVESDGGTYEDGWVFKLTPNGTLTTVHNFMYPGLINPTDFHQVADGSFYGAAEGDGDYATGGIFTLSADGSIINTVASFPPLPPDTTTTPTVLLASDGNYYASVRPYILGSTNPGGWVYRSTPGGTLTTLYTFNGSDGFYPSALIQATDGSFYGTTYKGGSSNLGTVFKLTPDGTLTTLHSFASDNAAGSFPLTPLIQASDGNFYGTTSAGGAGKGTVFKMTADGTLTTLHTFVDGEGNAVTTALVQDRDGNFYGAASGYYVGLAIGGNENPILFKLTPDGTLTTLHTFANNEGNPTTLPLIPDGAGNFFGVADGQTVIGNVFKETPTAVPLVYAPPSVPTVMLDATTARVVVGSGGMAAVTVSLSAAQTTAVKVHYVVKGSAVNGTDYVRLSGTAKIKPGKTSAGIAIMPLGSLEGAASKKVKLILAPSSDYTVGTTAPVTVKIVRGK